jgi:mannose-1-phosphate guanylyltransferase
MLREDSFVPDIPKAGAAGDARWAVITAGVSGRKDGADRPGSFPEDDRDGLPGLFDSTLRRLAALTPPHHTIAVFDRGCSGAALDAAQRVRAQLLLEPGHRGSASPVLLAASYILEYDPKATLLISPLDHVAYPEDRFGGYLLRLCLLAELFHDQLVVLGAAPVGAERDYGWLMPGGIKSPSLWAGAGPNPLGMVTYYDRPNGDDAERLFREGGLLSTGICAVKVKTLWKLAWDLLPDTMRHFDTFRQVLHQIKNDEAPPAHEDTALAYLYERLTSLDFSSDLLLSASDNLTVLPMDDVSWSDLRNLERFEEVLKRADSVAAGLRGGTLWDLAPPELQRR